MEILINIDVPHLERAIRFYQNGVGLQLQRRLFDNTVAEMHGAAAALYLIQQAEGSAPNPRSLAARSYERHWTPVHLDFVVDDMARATGQAITAGATLESAVQAFAWGQLATLSDPFGHGFCFIRWFDQGYARNI